MSSKCLVDESSYIIGMLAPAMLIIVVLSFMKKRVRLRPDLWNGRPGLLTPVSFLGKERNRLIIVLAFGATAASCFEMFTQQAVATQNVRNTRYIKAFNGIFLSLLYGIINYPYLACLNAEYRLIGYVLGLLYTFIRCIVDLVVIFGCTSDSKEVDDILMLYKLLVHLPSVICTILLFGSYAIFLFQEIRQIYADNAHPTCHEIFLISGERDEPVAEDIDRSHVSLLLANKLYSRRFVEHEPWYITVRRKIYETRPDFKFSTQFMSAVFVSLIFIYQIAATVIYVLALYKKIFGMITNPTPTRRILMLFFDYFQAAVIVASVIATIQLFMFIKGHRSDVLKTYRTRAGQLTDEHISPKVIVGKSLRFCGYQIAFTGVGMFFVTLSVLIPFLCILALKYVDETKGRSVLLANLKDFILAILPLLIVPLLIWLALLLLCTFVFRDRTYPDLTVTIDNRRLFDIMSYFFFFLNILVGLWSGLSRVGKGAALGLVFLCRLDRTSLMTGYRKWDRGYMAYIGFLNVLVAFRHPVMLCFCQVLIDERKKVYSGLTRDRPRKSTRALNRWFLAVLLNRNPSLLRYRKRNVFGSRNTYSSATAADMSVIVLEEWEMPTENLKSTQFY